MARYCGSGQNVILIVTTTHAPDGDAVVPYAYDRINMFEESSLSTCMNGVRPGRGADVRRTGQCTCVTEVLRPGGFRPAIPPRDRRKTPLAGWNFSREGGYSAAVWLDIAVLIQGGICKLSVGCENVPTG